MAVEQQTGNLGSFPSPTDSREQKAQPEWGMRYANAMWSEHLKNITLFTAKRENDIINRKYREGLQSIQNTKNKLDANGDNSYLNLDFSPITRIASLVDNIKGMLVNMPLKIQCNPIDSEAKSKMDDYRKELYANMYVQKNAADLPQVTGIPTVAHNKYIPKTEEEAKMHLATYRLDESIAMEQAMLWVDKENNFEESRAAVIEDLIVLKRAAVYTYYDENWNIRKERVDPIDLLTPYSKYDDFRNSTYVGIIKQYQLWEIAQMNPQFTDKDLWEIALFNAGKNANPMWNYGVSYEGYYVSNTGVRPYFNFNISVLGFYFITQNDEVRLKKKNSKGGYFYEKKSSTYSGETTDTKETIKKKCAYLYQGKWVIGTKHLWDYKMVNNQPREKYPDGSHSPKAELPISIIAPGIYDMENKSIVERLRTFEDLWNLAHQKFQQLLIKAVPPGISFDIDGLDGIILNGNKQVTPQEMLRMYLQTGSYVYSRKGKDGQEVNGKMVEQLPNGIGRDFEAYIATQQHYMQMMNDVIGFNSAVDGSSPNSDALVGVQKMSAQATKNALRPLYISHANLCLKASKRVALMIQDCIEHNYEAFSTAISTECADTLKVGKDLPLNVFGLELEFLPDEEEKMQTEQLLQLGLQNGSLFPSDVIRIRQEMKSDVKRAAQLLVMLEQKNRDDAQASKTLDVQNNAQAQQQSAQVASQMKQQEMQLELQTYTQKLQVEYQLKDAFDKAQFERQMQLQQLKNVAPITVAEVNTKGKVDVQHAANTGKIVAQQVSDATKIEVKHIEHDGKIRHTALQGVLDREAESRKEDKAEKVEE